MWAVSNLKEIFGLLKNGYLTANKHRLFVNYNNNPTKGGRVKGLLCQNPELDGRFLFRTCKLLLPLSKEERWAEGGSSVPIRELQTQFLMFLLFVKLAEQPS